MLAIEQTGRIRWACTEVLKKVSLFIGTGVGKLKWFLELGTDRNPGRVRDPVDFANPWPAFILHRTWTFQHS